MAKTWTCECSAVNLARQRECDVCGLERTKGPKKFKSYDLQCGWIASAGRCLIKADQGSLDEKNPGFCGWHGDCQGRPVDAENFDAFEDWWRLWYGATADPKYCTIWAHYPPSHLFEFVCGRPSAAVVPSPCRIGNCSFLKLIGPGDARAFFTAMRKMFAAMETRSLHVKRPIEEVPF